MLRYPVKGEAAAVLTEPAHIPQVLFAQADWLEPPQG
jgi:hypothetical protein